jgi:hypothetical protein
MTDERFAAYLFDLPAHFRPRDEAERQKMHHAYLQGAMSMYETVTAELIEGAK